MAFTSLRPCIAFVACSGAAVWANIAGASDLGKVVGAWESESICQLANSPCHDEHVIYEIAEDIGAAGEIKIEGYKMKRKAVDGHVAVRLPKRGHVLTCAPKEDKPSDWTFQIKDGTMSGPLVLPEDKTRYRKMNLKRIRKSA